ncbi:MAG: hypothetical protein ACLUEQ_10290 [Cloacibacillus evryensis]
MENIINAHTIARPNAITRRPFYSIRRRSLCAVFCVCLGLLCAAWKEKNMRLTEENAATLKNISNNINGGVITLSKWDALHNLRQRRFSWPCGYSRGSLIKGAG